jgi:type I restriction enzyme S subunit
VRPGDFLISWSATLGAYIWDGPEAVLNQHIFKVESKINKRFHYHLVRESIAELGRNAHGSGMVHVTKGLFDSVPVAIPLDKETQARIADLLDLADASSSSVTVHLGAARRAIERFRQTVLAAACSGRLTADWREAHTDAVGVENALTKLAASSRRRPSKERPVDLDLPEIPDGYVVGTIGDTTTHLEYGTSRRAAGSPESDIPILRMGNIQDGRLDLADLKHITANPEIERLLLEPGDLLFNRTNSPELVGKSAVFRGETPTTFASYLIRVRFHPDVVDPEFANYWINSAWGRAWANLAKTDGVSQSNINGSKLALMPIPLPPTEEQQLIIERATRLLATADLLLQQLHDATKTLARSSQSILAKAFRGELVLSSSSSRAFEGRLPV